MASCFHSPGILQVTVYIDRLPSPCYVPRMTDWDDEDFDEPEPVEEVHNACRCAECCRQLIIEVGVEDAKREPKIAEKGSPIYTDPQLTASGEKELEGYLLNATTGQDNACVFLDQPSNLCTIYDTRPWTCRAFDCDGAGQEQLIQLGIKPPRDGSARGR
jgi:Fe-S-cluster containining protein